jgi:hypothetical protein
MIRFNISRGVYLSFVILTPILADEFFCICWCFAELRKIYLLFLLHLMMSKKHYRKLIPG